MQRLIRVTQQPMNGDELYLLAFSIYFISNSLAFTMFSYIIPSIVGTAVRAIVVGLIFFKVIEFDSFDDRTLLLYLSLIILSILVAYQSGNKDIFFMMVLILGAKEVPFRLIAKVYLFLGISIFVLTIVSAQLDVIKNLTFYRGSAARFALGTIYPTNLAATVFYLMICYCYLRNVALRLKEYLIMVIIVCVVYYLTGTRLNAIISVLLLLVMFIYQRYQKHESTKFELYVVRYSWLAMIIAFFSINWLSYIYTASNKIQKLIDHILSGRLELAHFALTNYPLTLFGRFIEQNGWGGLNGVHPSSSFRYFFIDSSFVRLTTMYGIVFSIVVVLGFTYIARKLSCQNKILIPLLLMIVAVSSMVDANLLEISLNPFLWIFFANVSDSETLNTEIIYE
ncbi:hypothetical protein M3M33_03125 [Loigolactobacillus coryniformis]|uniref:hypothetical protein n=1 Tax=Loigolactobacillus coryniformis TaxID=1610 RepID=UPI00201B0D3B|nr:hypothetical protein [Loigolactobacillus coryniformis]MCL5457659.1 hypothetical protein [Loigolactobacillus coryniformis]